MILRMSMSFIGASFIFTSMIAIIFFFKKHIKTFETKIYNYILVFSILCQIIEFLLCLNIVLNVELYSLYNLIINRLFLVSLFFWFTCFTIYLVVVSGTFKFNEKNKIFFAIYFLIVALLLSFLPIELVNDNGVAYSQGMAPNLIYGLCIVYSILWMILIVKNIKKLNKKAIPFVVYLVSFTVVLVLRYFIPGILLNSFTSAFASILMFYTIENPDVKMLEQVNLAKEQADRANKAKTDFLSSMSHEIRTPLNAIVGFSQSLKEENLPASAIEEVDDIIEASETLLDTVNGILDISKIEANKIEIINSIYDFHKVFNELVALSKARLGEDRPIEFRYSMAEDIPRYLYGDYARVKQVILNFLTNAIKYTKEGYIDFNVSNITNNGICRLIIKVEDSGIGIKKESINKLFDRFERLDNENSTIEGTGLGLAITKKLVELMHGKIIVQSIYGKGSQFMVIIDQKLVDDKDIPKEEVKEEQKTIDYSNKKVLIVDDNKLNLKVAARMLKPYNIKIEEVLSGFECLDLIGGGNTYDLILMDDMMPKLSGKETFKKLKEDSEFNIPVVILTANAISGMKEQYLAEGFNDYLAKPIEKTELDRVIKKYLG